MDLLSQKLFSRNAWPSAAMPKFGSKTKGWILFLVRPVYAVAGKEWFDVNNQELRMPPLIKLCGLFGY